MSRRIAVALLLVFGLAAGSAHAQAPNSVFRDCDQCPEMVVIAPGTYLMGASKQDRKFADEYSIASELPQHEVTIGYGFAIGKFEVTVAEFAAYVAETGAKTGGECLIRTPDQGPNTHTSDRHREADA